MMNYLLATAKTKTVREVKADKKSSNQDFSKYTDKLISPQGLVLAGGIGLLLLLQLFSNGKKGKLATSYWGGAKETAQAKKKALKQITSPKYDSASLYIGVHRYKGQKPPKGSGGVPVYVPDVQRGTAVIGAPGSGKSFSAINPMIYSAIDQGFGIIIYDFKYPSQAKIASYAKSKGYDVHIFAPGFPESEVCNPIDFLRDSSDAETARQLATVINKNFRLLGNASEDAFFGPAGDQLTQAILMLTKEFGEYADIMTAAAILSSEKMVERLMAASLNPWIRIAFGQLFSSAGSEKTIAGIAGTASLMFTRFMAKNTLGCFIGKTTLPLEVGKKQMIIFGLDRERRDAVGPLMTSIMHM
ncbi:type IV secretory system conjugative DNA transfer family protein, partial [Chlorogloeopsis fritschii]